MKPGRRVLIYSPLTEGGIAEHAHYQAAALVRAGIDAHILSNRSFLPDQTRKTYRLLPWLLPPYLQKGGRLVRSLYFAAATLINEVIFAGAVLLGGYRRVLLAATSETLALVWAWPQLLLRTIGVRYAANIHDPQRKRLEGSALLHRWSVLAGFLPIRLGLVHEDFGADQPDIPAHVRCVPVPYGCYEADLEPGQGQDLRVSLAPEGSGRVIFLAFGYIADRKNIDLCIRAMADVPRAVLLVAGKVASSHDKPVAYYRDLADSLGCADRVHIVEGFVSDAALHAYFDACDVVLLTYKAEFVSQSGVLLLASNWAKPVLASSGPGPLTKTVRQFDLGPTVPPDDMDALRQAMERLIDKGYDGGGWPAFRAHASWDRNVSALIEGLDHIGGSPGRGPA